MTPLPRIRFPRLLLRAALVVVAWFAVSWLLARTVPDLGAPPAPGPDDPRRVVGAFHMHTTLSDGSGTVDDLVAAARANDLDFIIVSDHNTHLPGRSEYREGVLVVHAEEFSSRLGHVTLVGVDSVRLGEPDSIDILSGRDFHRFTEDAALSIASHPNGKRYWRDRTLSTVDGMEIWNADSEWRNDGVVDWLEALTLLPHRPGLGMLALVDRPDANLAFMDSVLTHDDVAMTCAVDAHARIPITRDFIIPFPSYAMTLGLIHQHLLLQEPFSGDADGDTDLLLQAIGEGSGHCSIGGLGNAAAVGMTLDAPEEEGGSRRLHVTLPPGSEPARIRVYLDGNVVQETEAAALEWTTDSPGVVRVEVDRSVRLLRRRWLPWIVSPPLGGPYHLHDEATDASGEG